MNRFWKTGFRDQGREQSASERGAVLVVVVVLSAIVLAVMTTMLYMVTVSTQMSGLQKRYRTAKDAALGGWEAVRQVLDLQNDPLRLPKFQNALNAAGMNVIINNNGNCKNKLGSGTPYTGFAVKIMTNKDDWMTGPGECDATLMIDPDIASSYDIRMELGTTNRYYVYAKIVHTVQGNTSAGSGESLRTKTGVVSSSGELEVNEVSSLYTLEVDAERVGDRNERAKFSVLYQY